MALPAETPAPLPSPQVVGNAFVEQYYHVLHQSPESVYKFYQESSNLSRPNSSGVMTSVTTTQAINDMVLSFDFKNYIAEILTVDSQPSCNGGVLILVTGCLTGQDKIRRKFTQSFLLAAQEKGVYFVLNDMFRFVDEAQPEELNETSVDGYNDQGLEVPIVPDTELASEQDRIMDTATLPSEGVPNNDENACNPSENEDSVVEKEVAVDPPIHPTNAQPVSEATSSVAQVDVPKKSYASIVKVMKGGTSPTAVYVPTTKTRRSPLNPEKPSTGSTATASTATASTAPAPAPDTPATSSNGVSEKNNSLDVAGHSVYIRNLPLNVTAEQVDEVFKKFGPIKPGGVQVRGHKIERFCFGFVEFESVNAMQAAIEASPILIGGRQAFIEEKRTTTRVINGVVTNGNFGGGRGRYPPIRGGFQNDNFRGRGGFGGNQGFGRSDFRNRGDYSARGRGPPGRLGEGYQPRVFQNGYGRTGRLTGIKEGTVSA